MENLKVLLNVLFNFVCVCLIYLLIYVIIFEFYLVLFICKIINVLNLNCWIIVDILSFLKLSFFLLFYELGFRGFLLILYGCFLSIVELFLIDESKIIGELVV